jgi:hypothetical protein
MLNPAMLTTVISASAAGYKETSGERMPWELTHLVAPLVLHKATRLALPKQVNTHLAKWSLEHAVELAELAVRARTLAPFVREGLRFGMRYGYLELEHGLLIPAASMKGTVNVGDVELIRNSSRFVGRWFGRNGSSTNVFALLNVQP